MFAKSAVVSVRGKILVLTFENNNRQVQAELTAAKAEALIRDMQAKLELMK
jgi:hypothetical protein